MPFLANLTLPSVSASMNSFLKRLFKSRSDEEGFAMPSVRVQPALVAPARAGDLSLELSADDEGFRNLPGEDCPLNDRRRSRVTPLSTASQILCASSKESTVLHTLSEVR